MINVCDSKTSDIQWIFDLEQGEARGFIMPYSMERHRIEFANDAVIYKSVWDDNELIGFLLLALDSDGRSIEFRRIVISQPGRGYGKSAVRAVDGICRNELGRQRVWLDVFEENERARRVYEQCGYQRFGEQVQGGRKLLLYEKDV